MPKKLIIIFFYLIVLLFPFFIEIGNTSAFDIKIFDFGITKKVSISSEGISGNQSSGGPDLSSDGEKIVFTSFATNLVTIDTNGFDDIFVHDRETETTRKITNSFDGKQTNSHSGYPSMSSNGRFITYTSTASNLVPKDINGENDVFLYDSLIGSTIIISVLKDGTQANLGAGPSKISGDGQYIVFYSNSSNLINNDINDLSDLFIYNKEDQTHYLVSVASDGSQSDRSVGQFFDISENGRYVTFSTFATNLDLVIDDTNVVSDIFLHDFVTKETKRVSLSTQGTQGNFSSYAPSISNDGRFITYYSAATNLVPSDTNGVNDIFIVDTETNITELISLSTVGLQGNGNSSYPSISGNGRYVVYASDATNLVPNDTNGSRDIFLFDRITKETKLISISNDGVIGNGFSSDASINPDGNSIVFSSSASNLVPDDNSMGDVFIHYINYDPIVQPFINLPFNYTGSSFIQESKDTELGGKVNAYFDHQYPTYGSFPNLEYTNSNDVRAVNFFGYDGTQTNPSPPYKVVYNGHDGIDFKLDESTPILAAAEGEVVASYDGEISGNIVIIEHTNGYTTEYWHLSQRFVNVGDIIDDLTKPIGIVGNTGIYSEGIHLHFKVNNPLDIVVDPFGWIPLPEAAWYGKDDPWGQYNDEYLQSYAKSHYLWIDNIIEEENLSTSSQTIITSSSGNVSATFPINAYFESLRIQLIEGLSPANIFGFRSLYTFSLFGYTTEDLVVNSLMNDALIEIKLSENVLINTKSSESPSPVIQLWDSETSSWIILPTIWDPLTSIAKTSTSEIGNFVLTIPENNIFLPIIVK